MNKWTFYVCLIISLISCEDIVDVKIPFKGEELVVEALIDIDNQRRQFVKLSHTFAYSSNENTVIKDYRVTLWENDSIPYEMFNFFNAEIYTFLSPSITLKHNTNYRLTINEFNGNKSYKSDLQKIHEPLKISDFELLSSQYLRDEGLGFNLNFALDETDFFPAVTLTDDPNNINYLTWNVYRNGKLVTNLSRVRIFSDQDYEQGATIPKEVLWLSDPLLVSDKATVEQISINKFTFDYYDQLQAVLSQGTPFSTPPFSPLSNIESINDDETVHGFFSISSSHKLSK